MKLFVEVNTSQVPEGYLNIPTLGVFVKDKKYEVDINNRVVRHYLQNGFFVVVNDEEQTEKLQRRRRKNKRV